MRIPPSNRILAAPTFFFDLDTVVLWAENLPQKDPSHLPAEATRSSLGRTRAAKPEEVQTGFQQHLWR